MHHHEETPQKCCRARKSHCCGKGIFALGVIAGAVYGMLFAKTSGAELRKKLQKSKTPVQDFVEAGFEMDMEFLQTLKNRVLDAIKGK